MLILAWVWFVAFILVRSPGLSLSLNIVLFFVLNTDCLS